MQILEAVVTTTQSNGDVHIAPMGPEVDAGWSCFRLRPFISSQTFHNLTRHPQGVIHVTDDVELIARSALGRLDPLPSTRKADRIDGFILTDACRWYAFEADRILNEGDRAEFRCRVLASGRQRDFFGLNRARHAVVELAIIASRVQFLAEDAMIDSIERYRPLVEKTGGPAERRAFDFLEEFIRESIFNGRSAGGG